MAKKKLTVQQALKEGYKFCTKQYAECILVPIENCDFRGTYILLSKEGHPYTITDDVFRDLIDDYLCNQDEVMDEDGVLNDIVAEVDYTEITKKVNEALSKGPKYYMPTNIILVPTNP